ncbi:MAG TPA: hypothetical protein VK963_04705 [Candidatus Saccharimonadales bacterium]|nr:hypothetical protein [Candidatus Saccharimonadales bacterium]
MAVLEVVPHRARFQIAFKNDSNAQRRHRPIRTRNGLFGMAIGGADVEFFALPLKRGTEVQLRLIEVTTIDNPKYANLALY